MKKILILTTLLFSSSAFALQYDLSQSQGTVVGTIQQTEAKFGQNITDLGQQYQIGYLEFKEANPEISPDHLWVGKRLIIPSRFILPQTPHEGIVINQAELRLYYYPPKKNIVYTYPIGIGRPQTITPVIQTKVVDKTKDPIWYPTPATITEAAEHGLDLPKEIPPGPQNPLGDYEIRMGIISDELTNSYLIHGTNDPTRVGIRSTGGCISMYPPNIAELYPLVKVGTPIDIINQPVKAGWENNTLYLEAHSPLTIQDAQLTQAEYLHLAADAIKQAIITEHAEIDWDKVLVVIQQKDGMPEAIGKNA